MVTFVTFVTQPGGTRERRERKKKEQGSASPVESSELDNGFITANRIIIRLLCTRARASVQVRIMCAQLTINLMEQKSLDRWDSWERLSDN